MKKNRYVLPKADTLPGTGTTEVVIIDEGAEEIPAMEIKETTPTLRDSGSPSDKSSTPQDK